MVNWNVFGQCLGGVVENLHNWDEKDIFIKTISYSVLSLQSSN